MKREYEEIIGHSHYEPKRHPRMSSKMRAAQFAPYAALAGYADAVRQTAKFSEEKSKRIIISDSQNEGIDLVE